MSSLTALLRAMNCKALLALALALAMPAASAQIYKWVDERGQVHYGEKPPAGAKPSTVKPPSAQPNAPARGEDLQSKEVEFRQRQIDRQVDEEKQAREAANRNALCNNAKERLAFAEQVNLYRREKGEKVFLTDAERQAEIASRRAAVAQNCR